MSHIIDWFFSLSLGQAMFLSALCSIIIGSFAYSLINEWIMQGGYDRRQLVLDTCDEFEYRDDPSAALNHEYDFDANFDDIHMEHAKAVLKSRVMNGTPQIGPEYYTCTKCPSQLNCAFAFEEYNLDGDCIAAK